MEQSDLLRYFVTRAEALRLRYFVTGSVATIYFGEPRFTNDIDIVVDLPQEKVRALCESFPGPEFYLDEDAALAAIKQSGQFNIIHPTSGLRIDVMIPSDSAFNRSRFERVRRLRPEKEYEAPFASPEDVILKKLEFYQAGSAEKHLRDIAGVLKIGGNQIDRAYISEWASRLGIGTIWQAVLDRVDTSG